jgi:citrate synthase
MADKLSKGLADIIAASTALSDIGGRAGLLNYRGYDYYLGIPTDLFTPVFSVGRMACWTAHVIEQHADNRLIRPDSEYIGERGLTWTPLAKR